MRKGKFSKFGTIGHIGIGATLISPSEKLTIHGNINLGFGVECPKQKLNIKKDETPEN